MNAPSREAQPGRKPDLRLFAPASFPRVNAVVRAVFLAALCLALGYFGWYTRHWQMLVNAPVMHYVNFLISHGMRPYRDITDMNMPGAYLLERCGMLFFGAGDAGWRAYDLFLCAALLGAMVVIAKPYDWMAGVFAGGLFALRHGSEGAWFSGEREQEMAVLLVASCAFLMVSVRRQRPAVAFGFGLLSALAASIKPTLAPFALCALVILLVELRRRHVAWLPYVVWSAAGILAVILFTVGFFLHYHAFGPFLFVLRAVTPVYVALNGIGWGTLLRHVAPDEWLPLLPLAVVALVVRRTWNWERSLLVLGAACGLLSYLVQRKGFFYQRYAFMAFALLLVSLEIFEPVTRAAWTRVLAIVALLFATCRVMPKYLRALRALPGPSTLTWSMEADLTTLGGDRLQHEVQCFDITFGCLNSLYHLGLVENTGFTGDLLLFPMRPNPATDFYRDLFWKLQAAHPAGVIVMSNQDIVPADTFHRLERWPEFASYLDQNYTLAVQRAFPYEDKFRGQPPAPPETAPGYRIYLRKGRSYPGLAEASANGSVGMQTSAQGGSAR